jgi:hypothetical protein
MPTVAFQFGTFGEAGSDVAWTGHGNAGANDGSYAQANLSGIQASSKLLICRNLQGVSLPANAVVTAVRVRIEAKHTSGGSNAAQIHEVYGWDNAAGIVKGKNLAAGGNTITLSTTETYYPLGADRAGWLFWNIERLNDSAMGVAIRCQRTGGLPTVQIDHVELEVDYERLWNGFPVIDPRLIVYDRVAGQRDDEVSQNDVGEFYRPSFSHGNNTVFWHSHPEEYLEKIIELRTRFGAKRLMLGTPAGTLDGQVFASAQWEPMLDIQRQALMDVIPTWVKGDPERQALLYLGTDINTANSLNMAGARTPDVINATDLDVLKRTFFPYRDLVGIKVFGLDLAAAPFEAGGSDRTKMFALFQWARENGMEFMVERLPYVNDAPDPDVISDRLYHGYSSTRRIRTEAGGGDDPEFSWTFSKDRISADFELFDDWTGAETSREKMAVYKMFARAGYSIINRAKQPEDIESDFEAGEVAAQFYVRNGGAHQPAGSAAFCATNAPRHLWPESGVVPVGTGVM